MKKIGLALCGIMLMHAGVWAQCSGNFASRSYDTLLTGPGYGNYNLSFPQWNPDSGQLVSVKINAKVSVQYGFKLKNVDIGSSVYTLRVGREDYYSSPALASDYDSTVERQVGSYPLASGASLLQSPFPFMDNYDHADSITGAVTPFLGHGRVGFYYSPITYTTLRSNNNSSYSYSATAVDQTHFSVTYYYCAANVVLASSVTSFTATLKDAVHVQLDWSVVNEAKGMGYEIQRSRDGQSFTAVGSLPAAAPNGGAYSYDDRLPDGKGDRWYYRVKINGQDSAWYTQVRTVNRGDGKKLAIYPNPAVDYIYIDMPVSGIAGSWNVEVLAADGTRVLCTPHVSGRTLRVDFGRRLASGMYFVRVNDMYGQMVVKFP